MDGDDELDALRDELARMKFVFSVMARAGKAGGVLRSVARMLDSRAWDEVGQYEAWLDCANFMARSMNAPNPDGTRWRVEFVPGVVGVELTVVEGEGVLRFEEGEEERLDVVFLLNELLHEVRGLREELREERKPKTVVISGTSGIDPVWAEKIREMLGWG